MTPQQIALVQTSFAQVTPIADIAATMFYQDLFALDPALRPLFKEDMKEQRKMLIQMLGTAVAGLRDWDRVAPTLRALGKRHVGYGVKPSHYDTVGTSLLNTLTRGLGTGFTQPMREAWVACYTAIVVEMTREEG